MTRFSDGISGRETVSIRPGTSVRFAPPCTRAARAGSGWSFVLSLGFWLCCLDLTWAFNLDISQPIHYSSSTQSAGSSFGYSVSMHENSAGKWVLVGAPTDTSINQPTLVKPGALYKCGVYPLQTCTQVNIDNRGNEKSVVNARPRFQDVKDDQWLGVSLARQNIGVNGRIAVCAHRWANNYFSDAILPNGACYIINAEFDFASVVKLRPCLHEIQIKSDVNGRGVAWHGWCQAGFSADYTDDGQTLMLGAVGSLAWRGSVVSINNLNTMVMSDVTTWYPTGEEDESYIGYSVSSGHFVSTTSTQGVTGAPRAYQRGKVYLYDLKDFTLVTQLDGELMGTYFGAAVKGIDLNQDGLTDLLVGAPLYSSVQDEGRVYIYINDGDAILRRLADRLSGSNAVGARFGSAIADAGDLNRDGHNDVAVGAPYEDDHSGAVYIYHGSVAGLKTKYAQRLTGKSFSPPLRSFGSALSGGIDMDVNGYPDLLIGAHKSQSAVLYLSKSIITMDASIVVQNTPIDLNRTICLYQGQLVPCVRVVSCFTYAGVEVPLKIAIDYSLDADGYKTRVGLPSRVTFVESGVKRGSSISETVELGIRQETCKEWEGHIDASMNDFLSELPFKLTYNIRTKQTTVGQPVTVCTGFCPILDMYSPSKIIEQVGFMYNCGEDSICETDLQLKGRLSLKRGTPYIPYGSAENMYVHLELTNHGEEAHLAQVIITHPADTTFVRVESDRRNENVVNCETVTGANLTSLVICDIDNPMKSFTKRSFKVKIAIPVLSHETRILKISVEATTTSQEANSTLDDNRLVMSLPVMIEADVTISGVTHPEQVGFGESRVNIDSDIYRQSGVDGLLPLPTNMTNTTTTTFGEDIGPKFKHIFDARNLGPSAIPYITTVNISIPWKMLNDDWLLYFINIKLDGVGRCKYDHILQNQHKQLESYERNVTRSGGETAALFGYGSSGTAVMDCKTAKCATISCVVENLRMGQDSVVEIQARFFEQTLIDSGFSTVKLRSTATVSVPNSNSNHVQPKNNRPDTIIIETIAYTESSESTRPVSKWVIAVGVLAGIISLLLLVLVLWKCGFFRRVKREEMQRLINDKDEAESLNPEMDSSNLNDPFSADEDN